MAAWTVSALLFGAGSDWATTAAAQDTPTSETPTSAPTTESVTTTEPDPATTGSTTTAAPPSTVPAFAPEQTNGAYVDRTSPPTTASGSDLTVQAESTIGVTKTVSRSSLQPGDELEYAIVASCSSLTEPCVDFTVTDTLPAEFDVTSLPRSNSDRVVTYDGVTRLLTISYRRNIGGGQTGLPAGTSQSVKVGMRLPSQTAVTNGTVKNTAQVTASNADPDSSTVGVIAEIPVTLQSVATKTWSPAGRRTTDHRCARRIDVRCHRVRRPGCCEHVGAGDRRPTTRSAPCRADQFVRVPGSGGTSTA
ncbi:MAG: hypothetical protein ACKO5A_06885 [Actinomycetota bacterium]